MNPFQLAFLPVSLGFTQHLSFPCNVNMSLEAHLEAVTSSTQSHSCINKLLLIPSLYKMFPFVTTYRHLINIHTCYWLYCFQFVPGISEMQNVTETWIWDWGYRDGANPSLPPCTRGSQHYFECFPPNARKINIPRQFSSFALKVPFLCFFIKPKQILMQCWSTYWVPNLTYDPGKVSPKFSFFANIIFWGFYLSTCSYWSLFAVEIFLFTLWGFFFLNLKLIDCQLTEAIQCLWKSKSELSPNICNGLQIFVVWLNLIPNVN